MNIVLLWAGGSGISSLWFLFKELGITDVICIDGNQSQMTDSLEKIGYTVIIWHGKYEIKPTDFVIYSDALLESSELKQARKLAEENVRKARYPMSYFQFLGELSKHFETISIAGTHGKSTTTALATYTLSQLDDKLGLGILGALVPQLDNKNYRLNQKAKDDIRKIFDHILGDKDSERDESIRKKYRFVIEADEFNRHFLYLDTDHAIILNIELDHSDIYPNEESYFEAYKQFGDKVKKNIWTIKGEKGINQFEKLIKNPALQSISPYDISLQHIFGSHNQKNASLVYSLVAQLLGRSKFSLWPDVEIVAAMSSFTWLWRRMEYLRTNDNGAMIYTDYWHHPTEIDAVHQAFKEKYPDKKIIAIVQPHQMRRVLEFWPERLRVLQTFDELFVYPIYVAREDVTVLVKEYKHDFLMQATTADDVSTFLASQTDATFITDPLAVKEIMNNAKADEIVILFTAWNLDYQIRGLV